MLQKSLSFEQVKVRKIMKLAPCPDLGIGSGIWAPHDALLLEGRLSLTCAPVFNPVPNLGQGVLSKNNTNNHASSTENFDKQHMVGIE